MNRIQEIMGALEVSIEHFKKRNDVETGRFKNSMVLNALESLTLIYARITESYYNLSLRQLRGLDPLAEFSGSNYEKRYQAFYSPENSVITIRQI